LENAPDSSESVRNVKPLKEKKGEERRRKDAKNRQMHSFDALTFNLTIDFTYTAINAECSSARAKNSSFRKTIGTNSHAQSDRLHKSL
jgi:UDP-3-O-acyl-N-acetylglucosamine deacetylase